MIIFTLAACRKAGWYHDSWKPKRRLPTASTCPVTPAMSRHLPGAWHDSAGWAPARPLNDAPCPPVPAWNRLCRVSEWCYQRTGHSPSRAVSAGWPLSAGAAHTGGRSALGHTGEFGSCRHVCTLPSRALARVYTCVHRAYVSRDLKRVKQRRIRYRDCKIGRSLSEYSQSLPLILWQPVWYGRSEAAFATLIASV